MYTPLDAEYRKPRPGTVLKPPLDVMERGRLAVARDPTGAFGVWQPKSHLGIGIEGDDTFCWADLSTPDPETAGKFYTGVFGWELEGDKSSGYQHIRNGSKPIGGIPPAHMRNPNIPPHWLLYFYVADVDSSPQGAVFALFRAMPRQ